MQFSVYSGVQAEESTSWSFENWGSIGVQTRLFPDQPLYAVQNSNQYNLVFEPSLLAESSNGQSFTFKPYILFDPSDDHRTRLDVKEAYYQTFGYINDDLQWELRLGINQIFWGKAESNNPVNIVNQTDYLDQSDGKEKLGQPMIHGTLADEWGIVDVFLLPFHRPRTFPGRAGRLRARLPVLSDKRSIEYEHRNGDRHIDFAARYSHSIDQFDFGVSYFRGTSREPQLIPTENLALKQRYHQIRQIGLEMQYTGDALLAKAELINQQSIKRQLIGKRSYNAFVIGGEYSFYNVFDTDVDLSLITEYNKDSRGKQATTAFQNDLLVAVRYTFNDIADTNFTLSLFDDLDYRTKTLSFEFNRRLNDNITLELDSLKFFSVNEKDVSSWQTRNDDFVSVSLTYSY